MKRGGVEFTESKVFLNFFVTKPVRSVSFKKKCERTVRFIHLKKRETENTFKIDISNNNLKTKKNGNCVRHINYKSENSNN